MQSTRALIIKYVTDDEDNIAAFYMDRIGNLTNAEVIMTLCALSLQLGLVSGKSKEETKIFLHEIYDSLSEDDFKKRLNDSCVFTH